VLYEQARRDAGRAACLIGSCHGWPIGQDDRAWALLLGGLSALFPRIRTVIADVGHQSRKLARALKQHQGRQLRIVRRRQRAFKITGLTWIVERSFAWLGRNRRLSKDYEYRVQTLETMIDLAAIRLMLNRIAPGCLDETFQTSSQSEQKHSVQRLQSTQELPFCSSSDLVEIALNPSSNDPPPSRSGRRFS
jgi:transposase